MMDWDLLVYAFIGSVAVSFALVCLVRLVVS